MANGEVKKMAPEGAIDLANKVGSKVSFGCHLKDKTDCTLNNPEKHNPLS